MPKKPRMRGATAKISAAAQHMSIVTTGIAPCDSRLCKAARVPGEPSTPELLNKTANPYPVSGTYDTARARASRSVIRHASNPSQQQKANSTTKVANMYSATPGAPPSPKRSVTSCTCSATVTHNQVALATISATTRSNSAGIVARFPGSRRCTSLICSRTLRYVRGACIAGSTGWPHLLQKAACASRSAPHREQLRGAGMTELPESCGIRWAAAA